MTSGTRQERSTTSTAGGGILESSEVLDRLEHRYERMARIGTSAIAVLAIGLAIIAMAGKPGVTSQRVVSGISMAAACILIIGVGYFLATMKSLRREIGKRRLPSRAERIELIRRVGELSSVLDASRELESASNLQELCNRLAVEAEGLASGDAALVVLRRGRVLSIVAATSAIDRDDVSLASQAQGWMAFLEDGALPLLATGADAIAEAFGEGPLAARYRSAMEVPLQANGRLLGVVVVMRLKGETTGFDADGLQAVGLLADVASHLIVLRRMNAKMRRTNRRLVQSMDKLNRAQAQLVQTEKLRAVGDLVSGVAHELNNPLTSLLGFAQLLTLSEDLESEQKKWVDEIQREAARCSVILQNLLGFARKTTAVKPSSAAVSVVAETLALKSYDLRAAGVVVMNEVPPSLPSPALDRQELQQVLLNLINNAIAAMRLSKERILRISGAVVGEDVVLEVGDTGCGIPEDHVLRIFEPFFSTKPAGDSIGLGLTTCRKIVSDCGGAITVRSILGKGTTFTLSLPRVRVSQPA
jgi:signal transduction histidine kinase